jgi:hypothetical protein
MASQTTANGNCIGINKNGVNYFIPKPPPMFIADIATYAGQVSYIMDDASALGFRIVNEPTTIPAKRYIITQEQKDGVCVTIANTQRYGSSNNYDSIVYYYGNEVKRFTSRAGGIIFFLLFDTMLTITFTES